MPRGRKSKYYKNVKNGRGTNLAIDAQSYLSVGPNGANIMIRGAGKVIAFECWEDLIGAIDTRKAAYHNCDPGMDSLKGN